MSVECGCCAIACNFFEGLLLLVFPLSKSVCLCSFLSVDVCFCQFLSASFCLHLSVYVCFSPFNLFLCLLVHFWLFLPVSDCLCLFCLFLSMLVFFLAVSVCFRSFLSVSVCFCLFISISVCFCMLLSVYIGIFFCYQCYLPTHTINSVSEYKAFFIAPIVWPILKHFGQ